MHSHPRWACSLHLLSGSPPFPRYGSWLFVIFPSAQPGCSHLPKAVPQSCGQDGDQRVHKNQDNLIALPQPTAQKTGHSFTAVVPGSSSWPS